MSDAVDLTALHEAGHAVIARLCGLGVVSAAAGADPGVRTRYRSATTEAEDMEINERLALVDLAGMAAEWMRLRDAWKSDEESARRRCLGIVVLRRGLARNAEVTAEMRKEASALVEELRERVSEMLEQAAPAMIRRVAGALEGGRTLTQADIDELMQET
jgi:ATP-dependent Zn protease